MIVERFKNKNPLPVYQRFLDKGRLAPDGLIYVSSWVDTNFHICFQIMETDDPKLIDLWISNWSDIVDFEVFPIIPSKEAADFLLPLLNQKPNPDSDSDS